MMDKEKSEYLEALKTEWQDFYQEVFGLKLNFSDLEIPKKQEGFNWLLIMLKGLTADELFAKCIKRFRVCRFIRGLDTIQSVRNADSSYAILLRDRVEADVENKKKSANDCEKLGINGITILERLLLELWYHWKTGKHLDNSYRTLCSGSRSPSGSVPEVDWCDEGLRIKFGDPNNATDRLCVRSVISLDRNME